MPKFHNKIINIIFLFLSMNVYSSYSMEKEAEVDQNTFSKCAGRVEEFLNILAETKIYVKTPDGKSKFVEQRISFSTPHRTIALQKYKKSYRDNLRILSLDNSNIHKIPTEILELKGCISVLDLSNNKELTSLPSSLAVFESEKDFSVRIQNTPLMEKVGKAILTPQDIKKMFTAKTDCVSRVGTFVDQLVEHNPQMLKSKYLLHTNADADLENKDYNWNSITSQYVKNLSAHTQSLNLAGLDIRLLPKGIINLKGCVNKINLNSNNQLSLSSFPSEAAKLGKDVIVLITGTPLQSIFGVHEKNLSEIVSEKQHRESGKFSSLALASEHGLTSKEGTTLPTELREHILKSMVDKQAKEKGD